MSARVGNLELSLHQAAKVLRHRRTYCCPHCGYQGDRSRCPRYGDNCEPIPTRKRKSGRGTAGKFPVLGIRERETGRFAARVSLSTTKTALQGFIGERVKRRSLVYTNDHGGYGGLCERYDHAIIRHSRKEYVREDCHTNGIESLWATFKRAYKVTHHWMSLKHLQRYVNECCGRLNLRGLDPLSQLAAIIQGMEGKRLTFKELVA